MEPSSAMKKEKKRRPRKPKSICLPFPDKKRYQHCMEDRDVCRRYLQKMQTQHPELFPEAMAQGFKFQGFLYSKKQNVRMRRIRCKSTGEQYQIRPSFLMPYMIGTVAQVEKPLFLRRWGVPFEALVYVFGKDSMYWYRAYLSLGRPSLVGTTIKDEDTLPEHVLADEKHSRHQGKRTYIPTTVAQNCILGADVVGSTSTEDLTKGYGVFRDEAQNLKVDYSPKTVNTDKWGPTQEAWKHLFSTITIILCFLHAFIKIKERCRRDHSLFAPLQDKIWNLYQAPSVASFAQRCRRLKEWIHPQEMIASGKEKVLELCDNAKAFKRAYTFPGAYRTSNALERLMNYMDRLLYSAQYFHGHTASASLYVRAMALLWNFHPYDCRTQMKHGQGASPFQCLNGFRYHDNWLQNLLIAASLGGRKT